MNSFYNSLESFSTLYSVRHFNSQCILGPPLNWNGIKPPDGTEIYIYNLPYDLKPYEIIPRYLYFGEIYEFRFFLTFAGVSRGYCFCRYMKVNSAQRALSELKEIFIRPGVKIYTVRSKDNRVLVLSNIDRNLKYLDISNFLFTNLDHIVNIFFDENDPSCRINLGTVFILFPNHRSAQIAFIQLRASLKHSTVVVKWSKKGLH